MLLCHPERDLSCAVHGDDLLVLDRMPIWIGTKSSWPWALRSRFVDDWGKDALDQMRFEFSIALCALRRMVYIMRRILGIST